MLGGRGQSGVASFGDKAQATVEAQCSGFDAAKDSTL
ncbi:hypothetical protein ANAPH2_00780 [Anaplasma phagocytophilum]|nr:hypothetical protein ANAPH2_00780 [Anaplasma phagocytophilum]